MHKLKTFNMQNGKVSCTCGWVSFGAYDLSSADREIAYHQREVSSQPSKPRDRVPGHDPKTGRIYTK